MVVRKAEMLPIECIVRGYISGSAWAEYKRSGTMHGQVAPDGHAASPSSCRNPFSLLSTKATVGHDENISFEAAADLVGDRPAWAAREICLEAYRLGVGAGLRAAASSLRTPSSSSVFIDGEACHM